MSTPSTWPSAQSLFVTTPEPSHRLGAVLGVASRATAISARSNESTPQAIRAAFARYSTWSHVAELDLLDHWQLLELGDIEDPDGDGGPARVAEGLARRGEAELTFVLGGDNAATWLALRSLNPATWGLITIDAHYDLREGRSNGSPVRQLLDEGLPGGRVVQIGLADFANSAHYAAVARDYGLTPFTRDDVRRLGPEMIAEAALEIAGAHGGPIYLDVDLDVCDRAEVPGCPAAVPGGLSADELRRLVRRLARDTRVHIIDLTELDVALDDGERTTRLAALCVLDALAGRIS